MSRLEIYEYSHFNKIISLLVPGLIMALYIFFLTFPFWRDVPTSLPRFFSIMAIAAPFALLFAAAVHLMYPNVYVEGQRLKIKTALYESDWFTFDQIKKVHLPEGKLTTQVVSVTVPQLPWFYWLSGISQGIWGPTFLIHPRMHNGRRLVRKLYNLRRDLFEPADSPPKSA